MAAHADAVGLAVVRTQWKPFVRKRVQPLPGDVCAGSVAFVRAALQSLGRQLPRPDPYPDALTAFLRRRVWIASSLGGVLDEIAETHRPLFVKPAKRWKLFTGFVVDEPRPAQLHGVSRREPVWCSEPVRFLSEWRVYVIDAVPAFIGLSDYGGDREQKPDLATIRNALLLYRDAPCAYAIDFGVLSTGETALIEANDGFSVGAYDGISASVYFEFISRRWKELSA